MKDETQRPISSFILHPSSLILASLISSIRQHSLDALLIAVSNHYVDIQIPLSFVGFLRQNVARMRMATLDLASRSQAKPLGRAFMCF
jgi:hypothetical protein